MSNNNTIRSERTFSHMPGERHCANCVQHNGCYVNSNYEDYLLITDGLPENFDLRSRSGGNTGWDPNRFVNFIKRNLAGICNNFGQIDGFSSPPVKKNEDWDT